jgi:hypothetical protein
VVSEQDRRNLYDALERQLGESPAGTLMDLLPPAGWADVARQSDLVAVRGELALLRGEMGELRGELKGEMAGIRGEIAMLSARVDAQIPRFVWANVPLAFGVAGLVLAAAKLA